MTEETAHGDDGHTGVPERPGAEPARQGYTVPENMTQQGEAELHEQVRRYTSALAAELDRQAYLSRYRGEPVEHTRTSVLRAVEAVRQVPLISDGVGTDARPEVHPDAATLSVVGAILMAVATVGVGTMGNFLHSPWQVVVFVCFAVAGVTGLALTWTAHRRSRSDSRRAHGSDATQ